MFSSLFHAQKDFTLGMKDSSDTAIPLQEMHIVGEINDVYSSLEQTQVYENKGKKNIEAIYTFPLPSNAVILNMTVKLGEKELEGKVVEQRTAERRYDDAIAEGSAAVMLEKIEDGMYTANVGNLRPGEKAEVRLHYAMLHDWSGGSLRLCLPTVIGERYGEPEGIHRDAVPVTDASVRHCYDLKLRFVGKIASAEMSCASHKLVLEKKTEQEVVLSLDKAFADRDFVLNIKPKQAVEECTVLTGADGKGSVVALALTPKPENPENIPPRSIDIVIDCSGSMMGTSIQQARKGSRHILQMLRPEDSFALTAYGSRYYSLFDKQYRKATEENLAIALAFLSNLDASMGGTETGNALDFIYKKKRERSSDIFLITDGDIWAKEDLFTKAKNSGCRIFPIGVGCASAEATLTKLAEYTHGKAEFVTPSESMAQSILHHFQRVSFAATFAEANWPGKPTWTLPRNKEIVFDGDTFYAFAGYNKLPSEPFTLVVEDGKKKRFYEAPLPSEQEEENVLARLIAAKRLAKMDQKEGTRLAEQYQLISQWTNYIFVDKRNETNPSLPEKHIVPQMRAAGWGGSNPAGLCNCLPGSVVGVLQCFAPLPATRKEFCQPNFSSSSSQERRWNIDSFLENLAEEEQKDIALRAPLQTLEDLRKLGLDGEIIATLKGISGELDEEKIVVCFLKALADRGLISSQKQMNLYTRRAERLLLTESSLLEKMASLLSTRL